MMAQEGFYLEWFEIKSTRDFSDKYVVFGIGQWRGHIMNWRGCNHWEKKLTKGVKPFNSIEDAENWIKEKVKSGDFKERMYIDGGYHTGEPTDREVKTVFFSKLRD